MDIHEATLFAETTGRNPSYIPHLAPHRSIPMLVWLSPCHGTKTRAKDQTCHFRLYRPEARHGLSGRGSRIGGVGWRSFVLMGCDVRSKAITAPT